MTGLQARILHPELLERDCATCRKYLTYADGSIVRGGVPRTKPPNCEKCDKHISGLADWTKEMSSALNRLREVRLTHRPAPSDVNLMAMMFEAENDAIRIINCRDMMRALNGR